FTDAEDARNAVQEFNGSLLEGKKIAVEIAESRHREEGENQPKKAPKVSTKPDDGQQQPKLLVRNLPWSISTPEQLSNLFRSYGKIKM
uniref:hypothetical protein n=1 Tax=Escherichia coli TaxID=562 RepID=UPI00215B6BAA